MELTLHKQGGNIFYFHDVTRTPQKFCCSILEQILKEGGGV